MTKLTDPRAIRRYIWLFAMAYMVSYLTRINFGAVIFAMVQDTGYEKAVLSTAVTGAFITYGAGQLISGWLGDRVQPKKLLLGGLLLSALMNLLIPFCPTPAFMTAVWCVNGLAQAFTWPPLVRLMASLFNEEDYRRCSVRVHFGASAGTILLYLMSPVLVSLFNWRAMFWVPSLCGVLMALLWMRVCPNVEAKAAAVVEKKASAASYLLTPVLLCVMVAVILMGALRDGVTTWMPTYVGETYQLGTAVSTLTGVVMPLFGLGCQQLASLIYKRLGNRPLPVGIILAVVGACATVLLIFTTGKSPLLSVFGAALLTGSMHGINMTLISLLPAYYRDTGHVSTISGVLNACVYIGSAISTYGFAAMSEAAGWNAVIVLWLILALGIAVLSIVGLPDWKRRFPK